MDDLAKASMAVFDRHAAAMSSNDPDTIAADYADDCVVLTTFSPEPLNGRSAVASWLKGFLSDMPSEIEGAAQAPVFKRKEAVGEYVYIVVDLGNGLTATETYHIRNDEVLFESATFPF